MHFSGGQNNLLKIILLEARGTFSFFCSANAVEFSCTCVQPPVLYGAFMFHPSGTDTQPGADGLTNDTETNNTANKPRKVLIGQYLLFFFFFF